VLAKEVGEAPVPLPDDDPAFDAYHDWLMDSWFDDPSLQPTPSERAALMRLESGRRQDIVLLIVTDQAASVQEKRERLEAIVSRLTASGGPMNSGDGTGGIRIDEGILGVRNRRFIEAALAERTLAGNRRALSALLAAWTLSIHWYDRDVLRTLNAVDVLTLVRRLAGCVDQAGAQDVVDTFPTRLASPYPRDRKTLLDAIRGRPERPEGVAARSW
jgi:hypothetical protein